jgi:enterochelin esterase-like enzyme
VYNSKYTKRILPLLWSFPALLLSLLSGLYLFSNTVFSGPATVIINIGLDPLRAQLVTALIMTAGAALIGATLGRRRFAALIGATCIYLIDYLEGFIHSELQPLHDPGGLLEPLNTDALVHTSFILLGLGIVSAFVGVAVGSTLGEIVIAPIYQLIGYVLQHLATIIATQRARRQGTMETRAEPMHTPLSWTTLAAQWGGALLMIALLALVANSANLFFFSPDVGLHSVPVVKTSGSIPSHGTVVTDSFASKALHGQTKSFLVYLPPTYNTPQGQNKYYPTLYLLHGSPGKDIDWITGGKAVQSADTLIAAHKIPELIIVFPDGNGRPKETSEWGNSGDHQQLIENYVAYDLVQYIDHHYRTLPDPGDRAIGGLSMGGFGAMNIAVHHPDIFGTVISLGGYYRAEGTIWGKNSAYIRYNSPLEMLPMTKAAWRLHFFLGAATKDQPYYSDTRQFAQELDKLHIPYHFDLERGYHSWAVWQVQMYKALLWLQWEATTNNNRLKEPQAPSAISHPPLSSLKYAS